jgi:hypothetical protein
MGGFGMGEIKSTLDLVMERTRHLSMSAQEKLQQRQTEFAKRLQGLLQQYADGAMAVERLRDQINTLQARFSMTDPEPVLTGIIKRIDPEKDNQPWLALLTDRAPVISRRLEEILTTFQKERASLFAVTGERLREAMARRHGINGSAVVPNPATNPDFVEQLAQLRQKTHSRLNDLLHKE